MHSLYYRIILHYSTAFDYRLAVTILRLPDGLDYSKIIGEEQSGVPSTDITLTAVPSRTDLCSSVSNRIMHADSNLSISNSVTLSEGQVSPGYPVISK